MMTINNTFCKRTRSAEPMRVSRGSVMMEYLVVQVLVSCLLMLVMNELFYDWATAKFGPAGMGIKFFYQRLLGGLSLPVP